MNREMRPWAPRAVWVAGGLAAVLGAAGVRAQQVIDLPAEDRLLEADFELVFRIGSADAEAEWELFTAIRHLGFDGAGNLRMLDAPGPEPGTRIVIVDAAGRYVSEFGRHGDGPGEFGMPAQLVVWPDGTMLVQDILRMGYHVFGPGGDFVRLVRDELGRDMQPERTGTRTLLGGSWDDPAGRGRPILRFDLSSEEMTSRTLVDTWTPRGAGEGRNGADAGRVRVRIPLPGAQEVVGDGEWGFEPALLLDALPSGGIVFSDSSAYAIKVTDPSGSVSRVIRRSIQPMPVTEEIRRAERERRLEDARNLPVSARGEPSAEAAAMMNYFLAAREAEVENMRFYPEVPVIESLRATWDGTLWVQRSTEPGATEPGPIDLITPDGRYIGTLPRGRLAMPDAFGPNGLIAFIGTDELDVPVITVRRVPAAIR